MTTLVVIAKWAVNGGGTAILAKPGLRRREKRVVIALEQGRAQVEEVELFRPSCRTNLLLRDWCSPMRL